MHDTATQTHLSEQQLARVEALKVAAAILPSRGLASKGALEPDPLIDIAHYVITGRDRWFEREEERTDPKPADTTTPDFD